MRKSEPRSVQSYSEYFLSMKQQRRFIVRCVPVERTLRFKCKLSLFWNRSIYDEKRDTMSKSFLAWISELSNAVECCIVYQMIHCYEKKKMVFIRVHLWMVCEAVKANICVILRESQSKLRQLKVHDKMIAVTRWIYIFCCMQIWPIHLLNLGYFVVEWKKKVLAKENLLQCVCVEKV